MNNPKNSKQFSATHKPRKSYNPNNSTKFQTHKLKKIKESTVIAISGDDAIFLRDRGLHANGDGLLAVV